MSWGFVISGFRGLFGWDAWCAMETCLPGFRVTGCACKVLIARYASKVWFMVFGLEVWLVGIMGFGVGNFVLRVFRGFVR